MWAWILAASCGGPSEQTEVADASVRVRLPHHAYIWQRQWTADVREAARAGASVFEAYRIQALAVDGTGSVLVEVPLDALTGIVVPVARIEVEVERPWADEVGPTLAGVVERWRAAGRRVPAVEIDHDCPTAHLGRYAADLVVIRAALPADVALWHTALPTWTGAPEALRALREAADASTLQVHAVDTPDQPLFDAGRAERWIRRYAEVSSAPFYVAVPAYGLRVDVGGAVEAEVPRVAMADGGDERWVEPRAVAGLLGSLGARRPAGWIGVAWFRLPTGADRRAWPLETLAAVVRGDVPAARWDVRVLAPSPSGPLDLVLQNVGDGPGRPPAVTVSGDCPVADGVQGTGVRRTSSGWTMEPAPGPVNPGEERVLGWVRCADRPTVTAGP